MTDAELALFLRLRDQAAKWYRQSEPMLREAVKLRDQAAKWYRQRPGPTLIDHSPPMPSWASWRGGVRCAFCRAPTPAISHEGFQPTRRRIGF